MNNKILNHFDLWLKLLLKHFHDHRIQGRIFFFQIGLSVLFWSIIVGIYTGQAIHDWINLMRVCK